MIHNLCKSRLNAILFQVINEIILSTTGFVFGTGIKWFRLLKLSIYTLVSYYYSIAMESSFEKSPGIDHDENSRDVDHQEVRYFLVVQLLLFI